MRRTILALTAGAAAGAAATWFLTDLRPGEAPLEAQRSSPEQSGRAASAAAPAPADPDAEASSAARLTPVAERLAVYTLAAGARDVEALVESIERTAILRASHARDFRLDALLARLAELDAPRAVALAEELGLRTRFLAPLFQVWAETDAEAALDALAGIRNPAEARAIALALVEVLGNDESAIERVLAVLPGANQLGFRLDALAQTAELDPLAALEQALAWNEWNDDAARARAVRRVAEIWSGQDPEVALAQTQVIGAPGLREQFRETVLRRWASLDPETVLAYIINGTDPELRQITASRGALQVIARDRPEQLLAVVDDLPPQTANMAARWALQSLVGRDPQAALDYAKALPLGREREQMLSVVAATYGENDPDAALAWARSLQPPSTEVFNAVLGGIGTVDMDRAFALALAEVSAENQWRALQQIVMRSWTTPAVRRAEIASRLLGVDEDLRGPAFSRLSQIWVQQDPEGALEWVVSRGAEIDPATLRDLARDFAMRVPETAARYTDRMPAAVRGEWVASVAQGYAQSDPAGALDWIARYQGQDGYEDGVAAIAQFSAQYDPRAAAGLVESLDGAAQADASGAVAMAWAREDPRAAAQWAARLEAPAARTAAYSTIVREWARQDLPSARQWVAGLERGAERDDALRDLVGVAVLSGPLDDAMLDAFSTDMARQQAVVRAVNRLAGEDPERARALLDAQVTDSTLRRQGEQYLDRAGRGPRMFLPNGIVIR